MRRICALHGSIAKTSGEKLGGEGLPALLERGKKGHSKIEFRKSPPKALLGGSGEPENKALPKAFEHQNVLLERERIGEFMSRRPQGKKKDLGGDRIEGSKAPFHGPHNTIEKGYHLVYDQEVKNHRFYKADVKTCCGESVKDKRRRTFGECWRVNMRTIGTGTERRPEVLPFDRNRGVKQRILVRQVNSCPLSGRPVFMVSRIDVWIRGTRKTR